MLVPLYQALSVDIAIIFLAITPFVWPYLMHPLERLGWVSGIILVLIELLTWVVGNLDFQYRMVIGIAAIVVLGFTAVWSRITKPAHGAQKFSIFEKKLYMTRLERLRDQPKRDALTDQLQFVYRPLYLAVLKMKGGKDVLPKEGALWGTAGSVNNPWTFDPKISGQVVDVFSKHLALIENEDVRLGWEENKDNLKKGNFWYGERQRKWLESIEREYNRIKRERDSL
jgi:hypothetical protein